MTFKLLFGDESAIPESLRERAKPADGGGFVVEHDPNSGFAYENVVGLKTTLSERKEAERKAKERLKAFEGIDPGKVAEMQEELERLRDAEPDEKVKSAYEAKIAQLQEKWGTEVKTRETRIGSLEADLQKMVVDNAAIAAISRHDGIEGLLLPVIKNSVRAVRNEETGKWTAEVLDANGNPRITMKTGQDGPMTLDEYVETLKKDPVYGRAFKGTGAAGSGAPGSNGAAGGSGGMDALAKLPPAERMAALRRNGGS